LDLSLYRVIRIPKKNGMRIIHAPCDELKEKQREYLANEIRIQTKWPKGLTAFLPGRSIVDAARPHVGKAFLVHVDIKDFFHHVTKAHVVRAMIFDRYLPREIETRLSPISSMDWKRLGPPYGLLDLAFIPSPKVPGEECLPQGGPLSPHLSLMASKPIYFKVLKMVRRLNLNASVTMYADGIFLSSDDKRVIPVGLHGVERILATEGFKVNRDKFRVTRQSASQRVCGISVNRKLSVPKNKRREIRGRIHNLYMDSKSGREVDIEEFLSVEGYISFSLAVNKPWAETYRPFISFIRSHLFGQK
jgi:hypothetical protein